MILLSYFGEPANYPFLVALFVVFVLAAIEGVGLLIGAGIFGFLDGVLPDIDLGTELDIDIDMPDMQTPSMTGQFLSWLRMGRVPVVFFTNRLACCFRFDRLDDPRSEPVNIRERTACHCSGSTGPSSIHNRFSGLGNRFLALVLPRDETSAISRNRLIGKIATITLGEARHDFPAPSQGNRSVWPHSLYIMLAPDNEDESYRQGDRLLLVRLCDNTYYGIQSTSNALK